MISDKQLQLLRLLIREEIGRNYHTLDNSPYHYSEFPGYDVQIHPNHKQSYTVTINFEEKPIGYDREFNSREEANLFAQQTVERHKLENY